MAITQDKTATNQVNSTAGTTANPAIPSSLTTSHLMILVVVTAGNTSASMATPSGWTSVLSPALNSASTATIGVWQRFWQAGDGAPSVTWTGSHKNVSCIVPFLGADATTPIDVTSTSANGSSVSAASPSLACVTTGACRLHIAGRAGTSTSTPDFRTKEVVDITTTATNPAALDFSFEPGMFAGATLSRTSTITSASWVAVSVWLRPATPDTVGLVQSANKQTSGASVTATFPATTTANNLITAEYTCSTVNTPTIPSFTSVQARQDAGIQSVMQFYRANAPATTTVVATRGSGSDNNTLVVKEWGGMDTATPLDTQGTGTGTSVLTVTSGSTTSGSRIAIGTFTNDGSGGTQTEDANYTPRCNLPSTAVSPILSEDTVFSGGSTKGATYTFSNGGNGGGQIAIFKAASGGATQYNQTLAATVGTTATVVKSVGKGVTTSTASSASVGKSVGKVAATSTASVATVTKSVGKIVTTSVASVATLVAQKVKLLTLTATVGTSATIQKQVGKGISASTASAASVVKSVAKSVTTSTASVASVTKSVGKTVSTSTASVASLTRSAGKNVAASVVSGASLSKSVGKRVTATTASVTTITKAVGKSVSAVTASVAGVTKSVNKGVSAVVASSATLSAIFTPLTGIIKAFVTLVEKAMFSLGVTDAPAGGTTLGEKAGSSITLGEQGKSTATLGEKEGSDVTVGDE